MYKKVFCCVLILGLLSVAAPATAAPVGPHTVGEAFARATPRLAPCYTGCGGVSGAPSSNESFEQQVVEMVNQVRAEQNPPLPPFNRVALLDDAARYHAVDMGTDNYFPAPPSFVGHATYDRNGNNLTYVCACDERVETFYNYIQMAENSAAGYNSPDAVMNGWMNSSGHRSNILSTGNWEIGMGYYSSGGTDYTHYWNQDFGRRAGVYPIVINREAAETANYQVNLYIYGSGDWTEMRLRNNDETWTNWRTFQAELTWDLPKTIGTHTVSVEMRKGSTTTTSSDSIYLSQGYVAPTLSDLPDQVSFTCDAVTGQFTPTVQVVTVTNLTSPAAIAWALATSGAWFTVTPGNGTTPGSFTISPTTFIANQTAAYSGAVTVTATSPADTINPVQRINLTLNVVARPVMGDLPDTLAFTYRALQDEMTPPAHSLQLENVFNDKPIEWQATTSGDWFTASVLSGQTPSVLVITPTTFITDQVGVYTGSVTVRAISPTNTINAVQQVDFTLHVQAPTLGGLPDALHFVYSIQSGRLRPASYTLQPLNIGSDDALHWSVNTNAHWLQITPTAGTTPQTFSVTPMGFGTMTAFFYTGTIMVTVDSPTLIKESPRAIPVTLDVVEVDGQQVYLPLVLRN